MFVHNTCIQQSRCEFT